MRSSCLHVGWRDVVGSCCRERGIVPELELSASVPKMRHDEVKGDNHAFGRGIVYPRMPDWKHE